jgi:tetratricopeptide (TPR) repeat protein
VIPPLDLGFRGAGRNQRDLRTESVAGAHWRTSLERQNQYGYAGDDENPRELPKRTLSSMREKMQDALDAQNDDGTVVPTLGFHITFCDEALELSAPEVIRVPREDLWWLAAPGDLLLLSDRVTTHFTTMLRACTPQGPMRIIDEWPERVFLREGLNEADIEARLLPFCDGVFAEQAPGRLEVEISRDEYLRVAVGLVSYDTPLLLERLFNHRPDRYRQAASQLAFGRALMAPSHNVLAHFAAPWLLRAERQAVADGDDALALQAAAASCVAHRIAGYAQHAGAAMQAAAPFFNEAEALERRYGPATLHGAIDVEALIRLGNAAAWGQQFEAANRWLDAAIERDPFHDAAHGLRAKVHQVRHNFQGMVEDATEALRRNQAWIDRRRVEHEARDPRDFHGQQDDIGRISGLLTRRADEMRLRAVGLMLLGRLDEAHVDLLEAQQIRPDDAETARLVEALARLRADGAGSAA